MKFCNKINEMLSPNRIHFFVLNHCIIADVFPAGDPLSSFSHTDEYRGFMHAGGSNNYPY